MTPKNIPISAAEKIAKQYGFDQVIIYARKVDPDGREHMTTYGVDAVHCGVAARMGEILQRFMGWEIKE
jgi:hypothetical protein